MKKKEIIVIGALIVIVVVAAFFLRSMDLVQYPEMCFDDTCYVLEIAQTPEQRIIGLMNRTSLPENAGMLFIFEEEKNHTFWMKDTFIPLDMIWISQNLTVETLYEGAEPCIPGEHTAYPNCPVIYPGDEVMALFVLEVNAGQVEEAGIEVGDKARCRNFACV